MVLDAIRAFQSLSGTAMNWRKKARQKPQIFWKHGIEQMPTGILLLKRISSWILEVDSRLRKRIVGPRSASNESGEW
uniref:Uncharacterized protein n=1 Tax=Ditylenchus dipsaci TaxID=166011 RepID=A0A915EF92_9BILA